MPREPKKQPYLGGVTTHTFTGLASATPYTVWVTHSEIVSDPIRVDVTTQPRPAGVEPLALTLTVERAECTAGTRNPVTWTITGGTPPDTLTIDGAPVNAAAAGTTLTCGDLPEGAAEAPAMIEASLTDAAGTTATASAGYTIVPPLPAPTGLSLGPVHADRVGVDWDAVDGAGSQSPAVQDGGRDESGSYLFRYRPAGAEATAPYEFVGPVTPPFISVWPGPRDPVLMPATTGDYLGMVAAIRHPIEQETPAALHWSAPLPFGVARAPKNIVVQATHDTLDVSWDEQPYVRTTQVSLVGSGLYDSRCCGRDIATTHGRHHTRFRHLTPQTEYEITIRTDDEVRGTDGGLVIGDGVSVEESSTEVVLTVRTLPAPAALRLAITAERSECTAGTLNPVSWEIRGGTPPYTLTVAGEAVDPAVEGVHVTCGALPEGASEAPRRIWARVRDSLGREVSASTAYTIMPPRPASPICFDYGVGADDLHLSDRLEVSVARMPPPTRPSSVRPAPHPR